MDIQFYIKNKIQPWQDVINSFNYQFGIPKFDFLSYLNFVYSIEYLHSSQLTLQEFTAKKVSIRGGFITLEEDTVLDYNDIDVSNNTKSVTYSLNHGTVSETLECGIYIFYLWNDAGEEYYSQPIYVEGATASDFNDDFNIDFY